MSSIAAGEGGGRRRRQRNITPRSLNTNEFTAGDGGLVNIGFPRQRILEKKNTLPTRHTLLLCLIPRITRVLRKL